MKPNYTTISVETAVDGCGENCPDLDIDTNGIVMRAVDTQEVMHQYNNPKCRNTEKCRRLLDCIGQSKV